MAVGALAAAATVAAGAAGSPLLLPLSSALAGVLALAGVSVLLLVRRARGPLPGARRAGLAVAPLAGTGSLLVGAQQLLVAGPLPYPTAGDLLTLASAPFVVLMVLRVPRTGGGDAVRLPRLLPVALPALAAALPCLAWPLVWAGLVLLPASVRPLDPAGHAVAEGRSTVFTVASMGAAVVFTMLATGLGAGPFGAFGLFLLAGVPVGVVLRVVVTQRRHMVQVRGLVHLADHDPMTGLGNRRALSAALCAVGRAGGPLAVAVVNLDGFSAVNDRFGDRGGDAVLVAVARALADAVPDEVEVFRLGGDEFALVGPLDGAGMLAVVATARGATASAAAEVPGMGQVGLATSCGVHSAPASAHGHADPPMTPVGLASAALQAARRSGRDRVVVWSDDLAAADRRHDLVEARLRRALAVRELEVHLQPVVDVATGRVLGFEALSRWTDADLGPVSPVEFVAVAESSGLVVELGRTVMAAALAALVTTGALERGLSVAVNASPVELRRHGFVASVAAALAAHGVPADLLVVEVTEAIFVSADDPAVAALDELAAMGVTCGQGWLWWRALPVAEAAALLARQDRPCPGGAGALVADPVQPAP